MLTQEQLYNVEQLQLKMLEQYPEWRKGQAYFNAIHDLYPDIANSIRGTELDCFYNDKNIKKIKEISGDIYLELLKFEAKKDSLTQTVKEIVQNKELSLDMRWDLFTISGLGDHDKWINHFDSYDIVEEGWYDKHQTVDLIQVIENMESDIEDDEEQEEYKFNKDIIIALKEEILEKFI